MNETKKPNLEEIEKTVEKIDKSMEIEDMPLSDEDKKILADCMSGKTTYEEERRKILRMCNKYGKDL